MSQETQQLLLYGLVGLGLALIFIFFMLFRISYLKSRGQLVGDQSQEGIW